MDTKWKNNIKGILIIVLFIFGLSTVASSINRGDYYFKKDYFHTDEFESEINRLTEGIARYKVYAMDLAEMKKKITVTSEEIEEHRTYYGSLGEQVQNIKDQYKEKINDAREMKDKEVEKAYIEERDKKIEDIKENFISDEHVEKKIRSEKEKELEEFYNENYLPNQRDFEKLEANFKYYLKDSVTGTIYTNIPTNSSYSKKDAVFTKEYSHAVNNLLHVNNQNFSYYDSYGNSYSYNDEIEVEQESYLEGYISVPKSLGSTNSYLTTQDRFERNKMIFIGVFIIGVIALIFSAFMLRNLKKYVQWNNAPLIEKYSKISIDIRIFIGLATVFMAYNLLQGIPYNIMNIYESSFSNITYLISDIFWGIIWIVFLYFQYISFQPYFHDSDKWKEEWGKCITYRVVQSVKEVFYNRKTGTRLVLMLLFISGFGALSVVSLLLPPLLFITIPGLFFVALPALIVLLKKVKYLGVITNATSQLVEGRMNKELPVKGKDELRTVAENINTLKEMVSHSQKEQVKSERLKTELITNVSHDLRTPLTSIITYTDLLKAEGITEDERNSYVEIIDRKSKRLKVLIDDLFEASKMASGNLELHKERVDVLQLMQQAIAEHNEALESRNLQFRITHSERPIFAVVDGKRMWRVFDNILTNAIKYSLEGTRIYIDIKDKGNEVEISCKNVSAHELGSDINELLERFKRGDTSRNTEGSGLGLAIAKSIVDLHNGELQIEMDGDLFKVRINIYK